MSIELKDFRGKITTETDVALEAESRVTGADRAEVVREILHEWALRKLRIASVTDQLLRSQGMPGIGEGAVGNRREREGTRGSGRE